MTNEAWKRTNDFYSSEQLVFGPSHMFDYAGGEWPLGIKQVSGLKTMAKKHSHDFCELTIVSAGSGTYNYCGVDYPLVCGNIFVTPPGLEHSYPDQQSLEITNIIWYPEQLPIPISFVDHYEALKRFFDFFSPESAKFKSHRWPELTPDQLIIVMQFFQRISYEFKTNLEGMRENMTLIFFELLLALNRIFKNNQGKSNGDNSIARINKVIAWMQKNISRPVYRRDAAKIFSGSERSFISVFHQVTGKTFVTYLQNMRLNYAKHLLETTDKNITNIAAMCGIPDSIYFANCFHRKFGIPPLKYRHNFIRSASADPGFDD